MYCIYIYIYTYIHTYIHTRIHTYVRVRCPAGAPRRHWGRLGLWVLLRFRLTLAGHVVEVPQIFWSLFWGRSLFRWIL